MIDAAIKSAAKPEVDPIPHSTSQAANQAIRALKMPYLTNQEILNHEMESRTIGIGPKYSRSKKL